MKTALGVLTLMFSFIGVAFSAENLTIEGAISHIDHAKRSIAISTDIEGRRDTYFVGDNTVFRSDGKDITFEDLKRGQEISMTIHHTQTGPEIVTFDVVSLDEFVKLVPVSVEEEIEIAGTVIGVRPNHGALTIRELQSRMVSTFHVGADTEMHNKDGKQLKLSEIHRDDAVSIRYHQTEEGMIILSGLIPDE